MGRSTTATLPHFFKQIVFFKIKLMPPSLFATGIFLVFTNICETITKCSEF